MRLQYVKITLLSVTGDSRRGSYVSSLPLGVVSASYKITPPLIKRSRLTYVERGGVGKGLSDGWALNFVIGCTMGCKFCYVDDIHKRWSYQRVGDIVFEEWGNYIALPSNLEEAIEKTPWEKWRNTEVLLSSTHDPYLPITYRWTRMILEVALPAGVHFCIQTRSPLVEQDFDLLKKYREQVRLQVSIATYNHELSRLIEPRVVSPERRMAILQKAKTEGLTTGIIIAPVFPPIKLRPDVEKDLELIVRDLKKIGIDHIYGESLHRRGLNIVYLERILEEEIKLNGFDRIAGKIFYRLLKKHGLKGKWWYEQKTNP